MVNINEHRCHYYHKAQCNPHHLKLIPRSLQLKACFQKTLNLCIPHIAFTWVDFSRSFELSSEGPCTDVLLPGLCLRLMLFTGLFAYLVSVHMPEVRSAWPRIE